MINNEKVGQRIAMLRRKKGVTQEQLAEALNVTGQAVSKWEKGNALPDISLLPSIGRALGISIDLLLTPFDLFILEAKYGANGLFADVTLQLNSAVDWDGLCYMVSNAALGSDPVPDLYKFLIVRYQNADGIYLAFAGEGCALHLSPRGEGLPVAYSDGLEILSARYGCEMLSNDVTEPLRRRFQVYRAETVKVDHEWFSSPPAVDVAEHLSVLYRNREGVFVVTVPEEGILSVSKDGRFLYETRIAQLPPGSHKIPAVGKLEWGKGRDCTFAGALTAALNVIGEKIDYVTVMGVSGACWRLAFCVPGWDPSSADGLVVYDHAAPVWKALGYELKALDRVEKKDREQVWAEIVASIDRDVPVLAIDLRVVPEWGVITGYSDNGKTLWCRTYFDEGVEDYTKVENWPFIILFFGPRCNPLSAKERLLQSLAIYIDEMNLSPRRGYAIGYQAYDTWSSGLEDDACFAGMEEVGFRRRMETNHFCWMALVDARRAAAAYLHQNIEIFGEETANATHLKTAAKIYDQITRELEAGWQWVPAEEPSVDPYQDWTPEKRHAQAGLLRKIASLEKQVEQAFRCIV